MVSVVDRPSGSLLVRLIGRVSPLSFEERAPHEIGFAQVFAQAIARALRNLELRRRLTLLVAGILVAPAVAVAIAGVINLVHFHIPGITRVFWIVGGGLAAAAALCVATFRNREERIFLTGMCGHFGFAKLGVAVNRRTDGAGASPFKAAGLMGVMAPKKGLFGRQVNKERIKYDDLFTATYRGIGLWMVEIEDMEKVKDDENVVWMGTLIELTLPGAALDPVRFSADGNGHWSASLQDATAPAIPTSRGRPLLTDDVLSRLRELHHAFAPLNGKGELADQTMRVAMELRGKARPFQAPRLFTSVYQCEPMIRLTLKQIACVFDLIDAVADGLGLPPEKRSDVTVVTAPAS